MSRTSRLLRAAFPFARKATPALTPFRPNLVCLEGRDVPATFMVTTVADAGPGSLRQAVLDSAANTEDDTIMFDFGIAGQAVNLATPIDFTDTKMVFVGPSIPTTISNTGGGRIFNVAAGANVKVQTFTFAGGKADNGGAIRNSGTLVVSGVTFAGNQATADGGAIFNNGTLTTIDTVFSNNTAVGKGGAVANSGTGTAILTQTTIGESIDPGTNAARAGNTAATGAGVFNDATAKLFVINSTIHKNTATGAGGGVQNVSTQFAKFTNSTVAFNTAGTGGGLNTGAGGVTIANNTIFIGNTGGDVTGTALTTSKNNLIGDAATAGGLTAGTNGNIVGVANPATVLDPLFTQFASPFYPLAKGSPAIDKGDNSLAVDAAGTKLANDQNSGSSRFEPSPNGTVDIGSRELMILAPVDLTGVPPTVTTPQDKTATGAFTTVVITSDTSTTPILVTFTATKGTFIIPATIANVTDIKGSGTSTISFQTVNDGGALGAVAVIDYVPPAGVSFAQTAGEKITITAKNTVTNDMKTAVIPLIVGNAVAILTPVGFNPATPQDTARLVTVVRNPGSGPEILGFQITGITNGKLFQDAKLTVPVQENEFVAVPADAAGVPTQDSIPLYFQPTAGFTGAASFKAAASTSKDGVTGAVGVSAPLTTTIQVVGPVIPIIPADNPAFATFVNFRADGATSYDFTVNYQDDKGIDVSKLGDGDVKVTARTGTYTQLAKFLGSTGSGKAVTATYRITPPGGSFDAADKGNYVLSLVANELFDTDGNAAPAQDFDSFDVDTTAAKAGAPTAKLTATAVGTAQNGAATYDFTITFTAATAIDATTINTKDLVSVVGPNGYVASATFVSVDKTGNGTPLTATYRIVPPGGTFDKADNGTYSVIIAETVLDDAKNAVPGSILGTFAANIPAVTSPVLAGVPQFAVGSDKGVAGTVQFFNPDKSARLIDPLTPFGNFTGGIRTASADFNNDGVPDIVVGTGPGMATQVQVIDGSTLKSLFTVAPFEASFTGGVYVAAGDVNGDGVPDLAITPDEGGGPRVDVYNGAGFVKIVSFFGIDDTNFRGGARASIGDLTGDGTGDLVIVAGFGGGPRVAAFEGKSLSGTPKKVFNDFFAFEQTLRNGIFVTVGDLNGDGFADLIAGGGPGGGPRVLAFSGKDLATDKQTTLANFFGGDINSRGGIRVAVKNLDGDAQADLVVGSGTGAGSRVTSYLGKNISANGTPAENFNFDSITGFTGGVFVG
ncbi:beta strand repeat-containing protein [Limnoglobus roseus]|uniref:VCBS repeat-containing protein n=1 Tax=Limnoglobus roseus TaxID=2598579 RepID=A0A5C1AAJ1_9BACT|nr:VCBS repeat-containing protein [Limnoglobus roseus]QEL15237.1 hypothetical protein PX52LOC_02152 [Limnoglobus roseus]